MPRLRPLVAAGPTAVRDRFHALAPDASEEMRDRVADEPVQGGAHWRSGVWLESDATGGCSPYRMRLTEQTFADALVALYGPAQRDVLRRADVAVHGRPCTAVTRRAG